MINNSGKICGVDLGTTNSDSLPPSLGAVFLPWPTCDISASGSDLSISLITKYTPHLRKDCRDSRIAHSCTWSKHSIRHTIKKRGLVGRMRKKRDRFRAGRRSTPSKKKRGGRIQPTHHGGQVVQRELHLEICQKPRRSRTP